MDSSGRQGPAVSSQDAASKPLEAPQAEPSPSDGPSGGLDATKAPNSAPWRGTAPPGSLWRKKDSGRWYWRLASRHVPPALRAKGPYTQVGLVPRGLELPTRSRQQAQSIRRRLWRDWRAGPDGGPPAELAAGAGECLARFGQWAALRAGPKQARENLRVATAFLAAAACRAHEITPTAVQEYLAKLAGKRPRTIQAHRNSLHLFCRYLVRVPRSLDFNPVEAVAVKAPARNAPRYLDDRQAAAFLARVDKRGPAWIRSAVRVALFAGARLSSLRALRGRHLAPAAIIMPLPKTGGYSVVPLARRGIDRRLAGVLRPLQKTPLEGPLWPPHDARTWGQALAGLTAGLPVFGAAGRAPGSQWHLLRATWAVNCARRGATLWDLMAWGGWATPQVVMRYVNVARAAGIGRAD